MREIKKNAYKIDAIFALEGVANLYIMLGKLEEGARLIGWADRTRKNIDNPRPLLERANIDRIVTTCIAKIGEAAFSEAYEEGKKMSLDEAVLLALEES